MSFESHHPSTGATPFAQRVLFTILAFGALCGLRAAQSAPAATLPAQADLPAVEELRTSFTLGGKPVPPEVFRDFGDGDLADSASIRVTIDVRAAVGSNLYADPVKTSEGWVTQTKPAAKDTDFTETTAYHYVGATSNKLLVAIACFSGGGTGVFYTLHILDAGPARGFDLEGKRYERLNLTELRAVPLGDRWHGEANITGDSIAITTTGALPDAHDRQPSRVIIKAERP